MTLVLLAASSLLAAVGTRLAAGGFVAAAVLAARSGGVMAAPATWTAALAAGLVGLGVPPRRLALPALGATAALVAGGASNAATVLTAWLVASAAVLYLRWEDREGRRWALALLVSDALVAAAVVHTVAGGGLARWTGGIDELGAGLLVAAALLRVPLVVGVAAAPEAGLLIVRAQILVLAVIGLGAAGRGLLLVAAVSGAAAFAAAAPVSDGHIRDAAQEAGLAILAVASSALGWRPGGWLWGVLAGGTLIHHLRLSVEGGRVPNAQVKAILTGAGIGLPLLPAVVALAAAASSQRHPATVVVILALALGLGGRAWFPTRAVPSRRRGSQGERRWRRAVAGVALGLGLAAGLWAQALTLPRPPGSDPSPWPPLWAGVVVLAAGVGGLYLPGLAPGREPRPSSPAVRFSLPGTDVPAAALAALLLALAAAAGAVWIFGWLRGFL